MYVAIFPPHKTLGPYTILKPSRTSAYNSFSPYLFWPIICNIYAIGSYMFLYIGILYIFLYITMVESDPYILSRFTLLSISGISFYFTHFRHPCTFTSAH
jgi:hypothetical protein